MSILAVANEARVWPRSSCLASAIRVCAHPSPGRRHALSMGIDAKNRSLLSGRSSWWNSTRVNEKRCVVISCWWLPLLTGSDAAKVPFVVMRASMSVASFLLASTGPFFLRLRSPVGAPPGSQAVAPSQVDGTSSCNGSRSPSFGLLCGGASASCLRFCGGASRLRRHSGGSASGGGLCVRLPFRAAPLVCAGPHGWRLDFTSALGFVLCPGYQRFVLGSDGFLSLASEFDAGGTLGQ